jgi:hypothetical protein
MAPIMTAAIRKTRRDKMACPHGLESTRLPEPDLCGFWPNNEDVPSAMITMMMSKRIPVTFACLSYPAL